MQLPASREHYRYPCLSTQALDTNELLHIEAIFRRKAIETETHTARLRHADAGSQVNRHGRIQESNCNLKCSDANAHMR